MSAAERILERMRRSKSGWRPVDFETLYTGFDFENCGGTRHTIYIHSKYKQLRATVARHNTLADGYAATAVKLIDQLHEREAEKGNDEQTN
jgi:hypothetical protein